MLINNADIFKATDFTDCQAVIVAVSGGSDSLGLMFLLHDFLKTLTTPPKLIAVTVDHRLRAEAKLEAQQVADICQNYNIEHKTVCWSDPKPQTAISDQARNARYNLLFAEAQRHGASVIMTGHTLNDQAETYQMRLTRGSKRGLACMPRESLLMRKIRLIRPLLQTKRQDLRDYLMSLQQSWIDDPSNDCDFYERVRVRKALNDHDISNVLELIEIAAATRRAQSLSVARLFNTLHIEIIDEACIIAYPSADIINHADFSFTMGVIIAIMGGASYLPSDKQMLYLQQQFDRVHDKLYRFTVLGAVVEITKKTIRIWREARHQTFSTIGPNKSILWDGRYKIDNFSTQVLRVGPASLANIKAVLSRISPAVKKVHYPSLQTSVAFFSNGGVDVPAIEPSNCFAKNIDCQRFMRPFGWLISSDDFALFKALQPIFELSLSNNQKNMNEST